MDDGEPGSRHGWQVVSMMSLEERFVSTNFGHASRSNPAPCSVRREAPWASWRVSPSPVSQSPSTACSTLSRSACFFYAASGSLFLPLRVPAGVACHSTPVATKRSVLTVEPPTLAAFDLPKCLCCFCCCFCRLLLPFAAAADR